MSRNSFSRISLETIFTTLLWTWKPEHTLSLSQTSHTWIWTCFYTQSLLFLTYQFLLFSKLPALRSWCIIDLFIFLPPQTVIKSCWLFFGGIPWICPFISILSMTSWGLSRLLQYGLRQVSAPSVSLILLIPHTMTWLVVLKHHFDYVTTFFQED